MSFASVEEKNAVRAMFVWLNCSIFGNWNVASGNPKKVCDALVMENLFLLLLYTNESFYDKVCIWGRAAAGNEHRERETEKWEENW